jgi:glyoxylase-like metal-dependent hydrolase (beta-lactamase superfamily II)
MDHSPAALLLKAKTGAQLLGMPPPDAERQDRTFEPDIVLEHNQRIRVGDCTLRAIHTPGHASNHLCYLLEEEKLLFTGDHVMQGSTVVINPPDGDMGVYLASLVALKALDVDYIAPGHGFLMERPHEVVDRLLAHRARREEKIIAALRRLDAPTMETLLPIAYDDVSEKRFAMASRSLLAHLHKLKNEGRVTESGGHWHLVEAR